MLSDFISSSSVIALMNDDKSNINSESNLKNVEITEHKLAMPVLSVYASEEIYIGHGNELYCLSRDKVLYRHAKSIKHISGNSRYVGTASYDGTAAIYEIHTNKIIETVEGPDTEIKWIDFGQDQIAVSTRGKTVWILDCAADGAEIEVSKILEDHTQDVKGCRFFEGRLYSWSFDCTVKIYEVFEVENSWEMTQSLNLGAIVWEVVFYGNDMCCATEEGKLLIYEMRHGLWHEKKQMSVSKYPVRSMCLVGEFLCLVVNRNYLLFLNKHYEAVWSISLNGTVKDEVASKVYENPVDGTAEIVYFDGKPLNHVYDIMCCSYSVALNTLVCGSENGVVFLLKYTIL